MKFSMKLKHVHLLLLYVTYVRMWAEGHAETFNTLPTLKKITEG